MTEIDPMRILSSIPQGVAVFNTEGKTTYVNPYTIFLIGILSVEALGQPIDGLFNLVLENGEEFAEGEIYKTVIEGKKPFLPAHKKQIVYLFTASKKRRFPVLFVVTPIIEKGGELTGGIVTFRDITTEEHERMALIKAKADLGELNGNLLKQQGELKEKNTELEKLNAFMIGRELAMINLKEEIKELKKKIV
ncbi:MAG: PAS domain-containing protein [bacterium]|nr:PAS domain-containing protein [bacterium]